MHVVVSSTKEVKKKWAKFDSAWMIAIAHRFFIQLFIHTPLPFPIRMMFTVRKHSFSYVHQFIFPNCNFARANPRKNPILREYVLPDYADVHRGYVRDPSNEHSSQNDGALSSDQTRTTQQSYILRLNNERFTIPELLFHPSDVGYAEMGLTEAIGYLLTERLPSAVRPGAWANCLVTGGNAHFPGFVERL